MTRILNEEQREEVGGEADKDGEKMRGKGRGWGGDGAGNDEFVTH